MIGKKIKRRSQHSGVGKPGSQRIRIKSGQIKISLGAVIVLQKPADRGQRQGGSARCGFGRWGSLERLFMSVRDCDDLFAGLGSNRISANSGLSVAKRIMVVEDNDLNRKLFCDVLKANGFEVDPVADGHSVLEAARTTPPDLIIMDIQLPGISGVDLIAAAKQDRALKEIPVLAVTAFAAKGDEERIRSAGASGYLSKPVSIMPFMAAVRELLPA